MRVPLAEALVACGRGLWFSATVVHVVGYETGDWWPD